MLNCFEEVEPTPLEIRELHDLFGAELVGVDVTKPMTEADFAPIRDAFETWPHLGPVLPALGYGPDQRAALERTLQDADAEVVVSGTPLDLARLVTIDKPIVRARYAFQDGEPSLASHVDPVFERCLGGAT